MEEEIVFCSNIKQDIGELLKNYAQNKIFVISDSNTCDLCFPKIAEVFVNEPHIIKINAGEKNKNLQTTEQIWVEMLKNDADRKSLVINLGGGMVTDIGGFAASTFKRGIDFINIPTSLMAMVDASIGGKNGINLYNFKNQIGLFNLPLKTIICKDFLTTLPQRELISGYAEMIKHGLLWSKKTWSKLRNIDPKNIDYEYLEILIRESVEIKTHFVEQDFKENGLREALNFGHTIGHAIESFFIGQNIDILHGEAVAVGLIVETFLSNKVLSFDIKSLFQVIEYIASFFPSFKIEFKDYMQLIRIMEKDKKNKGGQIRFTLLKNFGEFALNQTCTIEDIIEGFNFYFQVKR